MSAPSIKQRIAELEALERDLRGLQARASALLGADDERGAAIVTRLEDVQRDLAGHLPALRERLLADASANRELVEGYLQRTYGRAFQRR